MAMFSMYRALRATSSAASLTSVAKIWNGTRVRCSPIASVRAMAREYTSSPVEQAGTQTRRGASPRRPLISAGKTRRFRVSKTSGSRKKWVTLMRMSWKTASTSAGRSRKRSRYSPSDGTLLRTMRRTMRRRMVVCR
jgi:hypothetical protein